MVRAAYSSGKPAIGVGAGNTPAVIEEHADLKMAVSSILMSKTFDNGVICASEQSVIVHEKVILDARQVIRNDIPEGTFLMAADDPYSSGVLQGSALLLSELRYVGD